MADRCQGITREGSRCKVRPLPGSTWCLHHDPQKADERAEWSRRGGKAKSNTSRASKKLKDIPPEDLPVKLRSLISAVEGDEISPGQANAIVNLAKGSVQISNDLRHEERIAALERAAGLVLDPDDRSFS